MKTFILLSALPGSGKSTWAEQYRLTHKNVFIVSSDAIRKELFGKYSELSHDDEVWEKYYNDIAKYATFDGDITVIADSTNISNFVRNRVCDRVKGYDKMVLVVIKKELDFALKYNRERCEDKIVPEEAIMNMHSRWEDPSEEVINRFDEVIYVTKWFDSNKVEKSFHYK